MDQISCIVDGSQLLNALVKLTTWATPYFLLLELLSGDCEFMFNASPNPPNSQKVYILCISIVSPSNSLYNEISQKRQIFPILLVGTHLDLLNNEEILDQLRDKRSAPIDPLQGNALAAQFGLVGYCECSAVTMDGVRELLTECVNAATTATQYQVWTRPHSVKESITNRKDGLFRFLRLSS
ncbi:hypothetical protein DL96DRAFT_1589295, partial [Flagelloscypha sp. PMI_526]